MDTLEAIATRRSNRRFKADPIPQDVLEKILNAAIMAPSGKNRQPWRFVVVREGKRERDDRADAGGYRQVQSKGRQHRQRRGHGGRHGASAGDGVHLQHRRKTPVA